MLSAIRIINVFLLVSKSSSFCRGTPTRSSGGQFQSTSRRPRLCDDRAFQTCNLATSDQSESYIETNSGEAVPKSVSISEWIMKHGMLFSSFSDGVVRNLNAHATLRRGLVRAALRQMQQDVESQVRQSVLHSPCAGPNIQFLNRLDVLDRAVAKVEGPIDPVELLHQCLCDLEKQEQEDNGTSRAQDLTVPNKENSAKKRSVVLRFAYVPTAMYALRRDSASAPGKQRQRARADAKKRRDDICNLVLSLFRHPTPSSSSSSSSSQPRLDVSLQVVTLDWDDGSLKHPAVWESGSESAGSHSPPFPATGKEAMEEWKPHLLYVQGGNTFWLHHCMDKGGWMHAVLDLVQDGTTYYCGSSAGAILAGRQMQVASWKEWDDCSVVPGRQQNSDWDSVAGLGMVGPHSYFPHMTDEWQPLVDRKRGEDDGNKSVVCLRDQDVCLVDGSARALTVVSSPPPTADLPVVDPSVAAAAAARA
jgi:Peptidase family S51